MGELEITVKTFDLADFLQLRKYKNSLKRKMNRTHFNNRNRFNDKQSNRIKEL